MKISNLGMVAVTASLLAVTFTTLASEANGFAQRHPRRAAVLRNDQGINRQLMNDRGRLGGNFGSLEKQDQSIRQQEQADAKANGGHITLAQRQQLTGEESSLRSQMNSDYRGAAAPGSFASRHPRRSQVLSEDKNLNGQINQNYGNLGGNYGNLEHQDQRIHNQEQRDARRNGGYITTGQQQHLDNEENHLQNEINRDK
jgi:hypothetical protein